MQGTSTTRPGLQLKPFDNKYTNAHKEGHNLQLGPSYYIHTDACKWNPSLRLKPSECRYMGSLINNQSG